MKFSGGWFHTFMRTIILPKTFNGKFQNYSNIKKTSLEFVGFFDMLFLFWKNFLFCLEKIFELAFFNKKIFLRNFHCLRDLKKVFQQKNLFKNTNISLFNKKSTMMKIVKNKGKNLILEREILSGKIFRKFIFGIYINKRLNG